MGVRLNKAMTILNISRDSAVEYLKSVPGLEPERELNLSSKLSDAQYVALVNRFAKDKAAKEMAEQIFKKRGEKAKNKNKQVQTSKATTTSAAPPEHCTQISVGKNSIAMRGENIQFFDGFYTVSIIKNAQIDLSIKPLVVHDSNSLACLRHVHRYFTDRFPKGRRIEYDREKVTGINPPYTLSLYVRTLHDNMDVPGEWWEEVQNERKPTLNQCRNISTTVIRQKLSLKNGYIDSLVGLQSDKKLIPVYEINHDKQEDAFIFSIDLPENRCAVVFENVSSYASTATEVFITKAEHYELCVNLVFNYFTDYGISTKRESLRKQVNPPEKFRAEKHYAVNHNGLEQWFSVMCRILEKEPKASAINFVSGLNVPKDSDYRVAHSKSIATQSIHNKIILKLYRTLCEEFGAENVGTEISIGTKRIDIVVRRQDCYDIYEIKSSPDPFSCITLALGQICQYAYLYCRDRIGKMIIVGPTKPTKEVDSYLSWFREKNSLPVFYQSVYIQFFADDNDK